MHIYVMTYYLAIRKSAIGTQNYTNIPRKRADRKKLAMKSYIHMKYEEYKICAKIK